MPIPLALYIHFPWCVKKCPYCDFNSHALRDRLPEEDYLHALTQDFNQQHGELLPGRLIETVFMGGGTPSLISPGGIKRLIGRLIASGRLSDRAEITLEANPGTLDEAGCEGYLDAGVNRLSLGVQSFSDPLLRRIGRIHSAEQARQAIAAAQRAGFERINLDLMYGLPGQSLRGVREDLEQALESSVSHVSAYQLTIEANTEFALNPPSLPDPDQAWQMHEQVQAVLLSAGFEQYEVSAYSRGAPCQHNLNYWQYGDYLAIGAGAHGKISSQDDEGNLDIRRYWNLRHPMAYIRASGSGGFAADNRLIPVAERDLEFLMNALRLRSGFAEQIYSQRTQGDIRLLGEKLAPFVSRGWLENADGRIRPTEEGFRYIDSILLECL